ncbi:hypothetical protein M405DRAFT_866304 [Rhizopogon salebrosus TDB-379]|nr:hypothetical protein M405DRAFT_866304 [Rhizopogon salebrosus TDB-379]
MSSTDGSLRKANHRKRAKLNVYTPPNPDAPSVHKTYTFVSRSQGFDARSSQVISSQAPSSDNSQEPAPQPITNSKEPAPQPIANSKEPAPQPITTGKDPSQQPEFDYDIPDDTVDDGYVEAHDRSKRKRTAGDHPLLLWIHDRDLFLLEFLRHEGRGDHASATTCWKCHLDLPRFRCTDCLGTELYCQNCIVASHAENPVHRIQEWTDSFFVAVSLKDLGLHVQLGHPVGESCLLPQRAFNDDFTLIDTNGIHTIGLDFCGCETAQVRTKQLLRAAWFPATSIDPRTAATFRILQQYHLLSFESKASGYEFYQSIARLTDNTGLLPRKDRYEVFLRMVREWRHLKMLKRAGRGHDPAGVANTGSGECAVLCPACPQPNKNLPDNWEGAPEEKRWLYVLFIAIDANFRLKRRIVSKDSADPGLSRGWAYFVDETEYKVYLQAHGGKLQEKSTCASHNAVNLADTKASQGLAATGVGTIDCVRHNMKLPNGVGDLQKGERYSNMDYLFFSALRGRCAQTLNVSYDIACQWHKNLWERMSTMPLALHLDPIARFIRFFVPKFHLPAHIFKCQTTYSFNFSKNEMGPGSRRDTLDDHFGDWNWKKIVGLGATLLRKMGEAQEETEAHRLEFEELDGALKPEVSDPWKSEIEYWEHNPNDPSITNPFEPKVTPVTQATVRLKLIEMEARDLQQGTDVSLHPDISPSVFIASGIDLENEQRRLKADIAALGLHATDSQRATLQRQQNSLQRKVDGWRRVQALYTPVVQLLNSCPSLQPIAPEDSNLYLPSTLCTKSLQCDSFLQAMEWDLCFAQAGDALEEIRQSLRLRDHMYSFKRDWVRGQSANTRAQNALSRVVAKALAAADKYHAAHEALSSLAPVLRKVRWNLKYKELSKNDVRGMSVPKKGESEGRRQLSWIWLVEGVGDDQDEGIQDSLRVEWCKARARSMRWAEEGELLWEEMRRVLQFLRWHAVWWDGKGHGRTLSATADNEGLVAYACRQAQLRHGLADHFEGMWTAHLPAISDLSYTSGPPPDAAL